MMYDNNTCISSFSLHFSLCIAECTKTPVTVVASSAPTLNYYWLVGVCRGSLYIHTCFLSNDRVNLKRKIPESNNGCKRERKINKHIFHIQNVKKKTWIWYIASLVYKLFYHSLYSMSNKLFWYYFQFRLDVKHFISFRK